ncbi:MAG: hypothetical protein AB7N76_00710 [Planctomycetota bacterium]
MNLPVLRGDQLAAILGRAQRTRVVLFSSEDEDTLRRMCVESGARDYLSKSLRGADLLARIAGLLA